MSYGRFVTQNSEVGIVFGCLCVCCVLCVWFVLCVFAFVCVFDLCCVFVLFCVGNVPAPRLLHLGDHNRTIVHPLHILY